MSQHIFCLFYSWWATSEPNNGTTLNNEKYEGPEECGLLTYEKKLKDFRCDEVKAYVCERQGTEQLYYLPSCRLSPYMVYSILKD